MCSRKGPTNVLAEIGAARQLGTKLGDDFYRIARHSSKIANRKSTQKRILAHTPSFAKNAFITKLFD
jgi:hypothetical protein